MRRLNYFPFALAALMLGACSSDKDIVDNNSTGDDAERNGYISVSINLPTQKSATRANDSYGDGEKYEYKVNDAALIIFKKAGNSEADYTFNSCYTLNNAFEEGSDADGITSAGTTTTKVKEDAGQSADYYGLVILNGNSVVNVAQESGSTVLKINGTSATDKTTFADLMKAAAGEISTDASTFIGKDKNSFFMTNAVLSDKTGQADPTGANIQTLVPLKDKIKPTESDAKNNATDVYVERAVAKVDVSATSLSTPLAIGNTTLRCSITGWDLANTNTKTYIVRNWGMVDNNSDKTNYKANAGDGWLTLKSAAYSSTGNNPYRTVGTITQGDTNLGITSSWYRTYFGYDPNFNGRESLSGAQTTIDNTQTRYCLENTFDVEHQQIMYTTCAIIKVQFTGFPESDGTTAYSWTSDGSEWKSGNSAVFYTTGDNRSLMYDYNAMSKKFASYATTTYEAALLAKALATATPSTTGGTVTATLSNNPKVEFKNDLGTNNKKQVSKITWNVTYKGGTGAESVSLSETDSKTEIDEINTNVTMYQYTNAEAYYRLPIKHFGDDLTPWSRYEGEAASGTPKTASYPSLDANNYLGRYGVLRNNWYNIEVSQVKQIGDAFVPDITGDTTWDDEIENWISVKVNVLSWAKRTQSAILGE